MSSKENNEETKRVKKTSEVKNKKSKKTNGEKKMKFKYRHPKIALAIKIAIILFIVLVIVGGGVVAGAFFGVFGDELKISESDLVIKYENSTVYDKDGNVIATLSGGTKRKIVELSEMAEYLPKAYVAIEDERFYTHTGVDIKRTAAATVNFLFKGGKSSFGGSTITQQLIKNITEEKDNTALAGVIRKVKEMSKAIQVEHYLSKDQILELYLNQIFVGGDDINGVALGAIYFFDKDVKDLSIAECAYMAGINHVPNAYRPFDNFEDKEDPEKEKQEMLEKINKRTKTVISKMLELGYITADQANEANTEVDNGLNFKKGDGASVTTNLSYHTEAAIEQILEQIKEETDMSDSMAEMYLFSSGLKIYTTQDTAIQTVLEEEIVDEKYVTKTTYTYTDKKTNEKVKETQYSLPTMVIVDHNKGEVVASATAVGSADERNARTKIGYFNYPTEIKKQTGSSMKPISVIAPGLESGTITGATLYDDSPTTFGGNYKPKNYNGFNGIMNVRKAIRLSSNIPHVKMLAEIGLETSIEFCKSVGLPEFKEEGLSLALGGLSKGVSMYEMAGAYSAIANDGVYIKPTFYTKVTDSEGNTLYEPDKTESRVMSEQNAYIEQSILMEPVTGGAGATASYCAIKGMDVAAKTGTTNDEYDRWLCGFTPYYTAATWYGYKNNAKVSYSGNPAGKLWDAVMTEIHKDLEGQKFDEPEGIIKVSICTASGKKAKEGCTEVYTDLFTKDTVPGECDGHSKAVVCRDSGLLPTEYCPQSSWEERSFAYQPEKERNQTKWTTTHENAEGAAVNTVPTERCNIHTQPQQQVCSHSFTEWKTQSNNPAVQERQCSLCQTVEYRNTPNYTAPTEHTHTWTEKVTKQATCKEEGTKTLTCSGCGTTKEEKISKTAHTEGPADSNGKTVCTVCGATIKEGTKPHTHSYIETIIQNATCNSLGKKKLTCDCGDSKEEDIPMTSHTPGTPDPVTGKTTCTVCGAEL